MIVDCKFLSFERNVFVLIRLMYIVCELLSLERNLFVCFNVTKKYKKIQVQVTVYLGLLQFVSVYMLYRFGVHVVSINTLAC